eukprot:4223240-Prymnesium_polylepis.1
MGEGGAAVLGAVALSLTPDRFNAFAGAGMLSPRGRCHTFDARADGYVRGEACGAVTLEVAR